MGIHHNMGREMLGMDTNSRHNRSGNTMHNQYRTTIALVTSHQCVMMLLVRTTTSLFRCLERSYLHRSSRLILTRHKLENPSAALQKGHPLGPWPRL